MKEMHIDSRLLESVDGKYSIMSEGPSCAGNWYRRSCKRKTEEIAKHGKAFKNTV